MSYQENNFYFFMPEHKIRYLTGHFEGSSIKKDDVFYWILSFSNIPSLSLSQIICDSRWQTEICSIKVDQSVRIGVFVTCWSICSFKKMTLTFTIIPVWAALLHCNMQYRSKTVNCQIAIGDNQDNNMQPIHTNKYDDCCNMRARNTCQNCLAFVSSCSRFDLILTFVIIVTPSSME